MAPRKRTLLSRGAEEEGTSRPLAVVAAARRRSLARALIIPPPQTRNPFRPRSSPQELVNDNPYISEEAMQLMKFHGSYMQDHREKRAFGQGKFYQFMMRTRQPAGLVTNQLYLVMDDLADQVCRACS